MYSATTKLRTQCSRMQLLSTCSSRRKCHNHCFSGSSSMPSASSRRLASSSAHVCMLLRLSEFLFSRLKSSSVDIPCVWLIAVSHHPEKHGSKEAIHPYVLPPLLLILLAWLYAKQPAGRRVIVVFVCVVAGTPYRRRGEESLLWPSGEVWYNLKACSGARDEAR